MVAGGTVWVVLALPLSLGFLLVWSSPRVWPQVGALAGRISRFTQLEWLFNLLTWGVDKTAQVGAHLLNVVEGTGYVGWFLALLLLGLLLVR